MSRRFAPAAALLALAFLGTGCKKPPAPPPPMPVATPRPTPIPGTIAFVRSGSLWLVGPDGGSAHLLAAPGPNGDFWFPTPAAEGFLAWLSRPDGTQDVVQVGARGRIRVLTQTGDQAQASMKDLDLDNAPALSPDGSRIAYAFNGDLWIMDADGDNPQTLVSDGESWSPAWSPDGRRIAYVNGPEGRRDLWVTDVDDRDTFQLTDFSGFSVGGPRWSKDGASILLTRTQGEDCAVVEVPSTAPSPAMDAQTVVTQDQGSASAVFSPAGTALCFSSDRADGATWDLYTSDVRGTSAVRITHGGGLSPAWSPLPLLEAAPPAAAGPRATATAALGRTATAGTKTRTPAPARAPASKTPAAARPAAGLNAAPLRLRLLVGFDGQDGLDAASMAALRKLAHRVAQVPGDTVIVVGPQDHSDLKGLYFSEESRSQSRAQAAGEALARLARIKAFRLKADPYSPPTPGGDPDSIIVYMQLR